MEKLEDAIKKLLKELGIEDTVQQNQVLNDWAIVVGQKIAEISHAEKMENNILFVKVVHSTWRNELLYQKKEIIKKINKRIGKDIVKDIRLY